MKKTERLEEIDHMLTKMKPELNRLGVMEQFDLHSKVADLPAHDVTLAYEWIKSIFVTEWSNAHFFYCLQTNKNQTKTRT